MRSEGIDFIQLVPNLSPEMDSTIAISRITTQNCYSSEAAFRATFHCACAASTAFSLPVKSLTPCLNLTHLLGRFPIKTRSLPAATPFSATFVMIMSAHYDSTGRKFVNGNGFGDPDFR